MRWKLGIFDWNGTLFNDLPIVYRSVVRIFEQFALPAPTLEQYREEIAADFMKFYRAHGIPNYVSGNDLNEIRQKFFAQHWNDANLFQDTFDLLIGCRLLKLKITIVSAEVPEVLENRLVQFELRHLLHEARGGAYQKEPVFRELLGKFQVKPEEAFYVDDSASGIQLAREIGIATFGYTREYNSREKIAAAKPDFLVDSLTEALARIRYENSR